MLTGKWASLVMNQEIFPLCRGFNIGKSLGIFQKNCSSNLQCLFLIHFILRTVLTGSKLIPPPIHSLLKPRVKYLKLLTVSTKVIALHTTKVINHHSFSILARCSPFASLIGLGNPTYFIRNGTKLLKKFLKLFDLGKSTTLTRELRVPWKEELTGPFDLPGVLDEGEFSEAMDLIGDL